MRAERLIGFERRHEAFAQGLDLAQRGVTGVEGERVVERTRHGGLSGDERLNAAEQGGGAVRRRGRHDTPFHHALRADRLEHRARRRRQRRARDHEHHLGHTLGAPEPAVVQVSADLCRRPRARGGDQCAPERALPLLVGVATMRVLALLPRQQQRRPIQQIRPEPLRYRAREIEQAHRIAIIHVVLRRLRQRIYLITHDRREPPCHRRRPPFAVASLKPRDLIHPAGRRHEPHRRRASERARDA